MVCLFFFLVVKELIVIRSLKTNIVGIVENETLEIITLTDLKIVQVGSTKH